MRTNSRWRKTICAAAAAMLLCTACGDTGAAEDTHEQAAAEVTHEQTSAAQQQSGTSAESENTPESESASETLSDEELNKAFADFGVKLLKNDCSEAIREGRNVLISPESVLTALGMTALGAEGDTSAEMQKVLAGGCGKQAMTDALRGFASYRGKGINIERANSVWIKQTHELTVKQSFTDLISGELGAEQFSAPFDGGTLKDINSWVNEHTDGMIPEILDYIDPQAVMYLINAIAFDAEWDVKYEKDKISENDIFVNSRGEEEQCAMLNSKENAWFSDGSAEAFIKPYKGGKYAFMGILPNDGVSVADYIDGLDGDKWCGLWNSRENVEVMAFIPEFSCDYDSELSTALRDMGMELPFTKAADFSGITDNNNIYISRVLHKTHIGLDRKGTKAAAATAVEMRLKNAPARITFRKIRLDRPFAYAIVDTETGFPLFLGAVNTVAGGQG